MRGASLITEGAWSGEGRARPPSRKRVRTRSQLDRSWRSQALRPKLAPAQSISDAAVVSHPACGLAPRPLSAATPPPRRLETNGGAAKSGPTRVTCRRAGVPRPRRGRRCSPTLPAPSIWPPKANSGATKRGPPQGAEEERARAVGRAGGGEGRGAPTIPPGPHRPRLCRRARTLGE